MKRLEQSEPLAEKFLRRFWSKLAKRGPDECWEWQRSRCTDGYGQLWLGQGIGFAGTHRISWFIRNGPIPPGGVVMHSCDNPPCCNPKHLILGTHKKNAHDAIRKGRFVFTKPAFGEGHAQHKLTDSEVREIRRLYLLTKACHEIGEQFGVSAAQIHRLGTFKRWKHLK